VFTPKKRIKPEDRIEEALKFIADRLSDIDVNIQELVALHALTDEA
jgi:hypothetical protein